MSWRFIRSLFRSVAVFIASLVALFAFLIGTEPGTQIDLELAKFLVPGHLTGEVAGSISGPLILKNISYTDKNINIKITKLELDWQPLKLFQQVLSIRELAVQDLSFTVNKGDTPLPGQLNFKLTGFTTLGTPLPRSYLQLQRLTGHFADYPLSGQGSLSRQGQQFFFTPTVLKLGLAQFKIQGRLSEQSNLSWSLDLPKLQALLPNLSGSISSQGQIQGPLQDPKFYAELNLNKLSNGTQGLDQAKLEVQGTLLNQHIQLQLHQEQATLMALLKGGYQNQTWTGELQQLNLTSPLFNNWSLAKPAPLVLRKDFIKVSPFCWQTGSSQLCGQFERSLQKISGRLSIDIANLKNFNQLLPSTAGNKPSQLKGRLKGQLQLSGKPNLPNISGSAQLQDGEAILPQLGLDLKKLELSIQGNGNTITYAASTLSGTGTLLIKGNTSLVTPGFPTTLTIKGDKVQVSNTDSAKAIASPDLKVTYQANHLDITGSVLIPFANITPTDFSSAVAMPSDVVYIDVKKQAPLDPLLITTKIAVSLGDEVRFAYKGLDAKIAGHLTLIDNSSGSTTANGELIITKGKYTAYGQNLTIENGRLLFAGGPVTNPGLSIEAVRYVNFYGAASNTQTGNISDQNKVGLNISGTVQNPIVTLFSIPGGLTQTQILSYLILGHSLEQSSSPSEGKSIADAAMALNLAGGTVTEIQNKVKSLFGLSDLEVGQQQQYIGGKNGEAPTMTQNTSLILGKYLTPKLYVNFSLGLAQPINTLNVTYQVTPHWRVQTNANTIGSGIDLVYTLERDGFGIFGP